MRQLKKNRYEGGAFCVIFSPGALVIDVGESPKQIEDGRSGHEI